MLRIVAVSAVLAVLTAGCGSDPEPADDPPPASSPTSPASPSPTEDQRDGTAITTRSSEFGRTLFGLWWVVQPDGQRAP
jgi:hypothetical protein